MSRLDATFPDFDWWDSPKGSEVISSRSELKLPPAPAGGIPEVSGGHLF